MDATEIILHPQRARWVMVSDGVRPHELLWWRTVLSVADAESVKFKGGPIVALDFQGERKVEE